MLAADRRMEKVKIPTLFRQRTVQSHDMLYKTYRDIFVKHVMRLDTKEQRDMGGYPEVSFLSQ